VSTAPRRPELRRAVEASERERLRWAHELHDETLQDLSALKLVLQSARAQGDPAQVQRMLDEAIQRVDGQVENLRGLITRLRPAALDRLGLAAGLEALATDTSRRSGLEVAVHLDLAYEAGRHPERLMPEIELAVYRIVQEALTNVTRHAAATHAVVAVEERPHELAVEVGDDGAGFDRQATAPGFGLLGMEERAALVDGRLEVEGEIGHGTRVRVAIPPRHRSPAAGSPSGRP
jgi:signal transduction histidine kinase